MSELPKGWTRTTLGELGRWESGGTPSTSCIDYWNGDIPWISAASLTTTRLQTSERQVTRLGAKNGTRTVQPNTILMVVRGMSLKSEFRVGIATREMAFGQDCKALTVENCKPLFVLYHLLAREPHILNLVDEAGHGTGRLQTDSLKSLPINIPPLREQEAIAEVLGALDDKIEANQTLAEKAMEYTSALFDCISNEICSSMPFSEFGEIHGGGTPKTSVDEYWGGDIAWATPTDVTALKLPFIETTSRSLTESGLSACSSKLHEPGTIMMTSRATIGAIAINSVPTATNQGFIVIQPNLKIWTWWLYHCMKAMKEVFLSEANGATFLELPRRKFAQLSCPYLPKDDLHHFHTQADSHYGLVHSLQKENRLLAELRDTLLGPLVSGRLRVKDAEKMVGEAL